MFVFGGTPERGVIGGGGGGGHERFSSGNVLTSLKYVIIL